ncbi:MAG: hypothetical protein LC795_20905 [Acidobacteria bacterium]|nr:hypothetical protein [Acidobacteriota bacterium]
MNSAWTSAAVSATRLSARARAAASDVLDAPPNSATAACRSAAEGATPALA